MTLIHDCFKMRLIFETQAAFHDLISNNYLKIHLINLKTFHLHLKILPLSFEGSPLTFVQRDPFGVLIDIV